MLNISEKVNGFLGLIVDYRSRTISREGFAIGVSFGEHTKKWDLFLQLYDAGPNGITSRALESKYPGSWHSRGSAKRMLNEMLGPLEVRIAPREWRLEESIE